MASDTPYVYRPDDARQRGLRTDTADHEAVIVEGQVMSYRAYRR